jgi:hypothetical protein
MDTIDSFGRTWKSNYYTNNFFCIDCRQPIPTWYDEPQNRAKKICNCKPFKPNVVLEMKGKLARNDYLSIPSPKDYRDILAGCEVRSVFVSEGRADCVVGCHLNGNKLKLYCGGEVLTENATYDQMVVLFADMYRAEFGGASIEELMSEFGG